MPMCRTDQTDEGYVEQEPIEHRNHDINWKSSVMIETMIHFE
jgi:hypothetical protein